MRPSIAALWVFARTLQEVSMALAGDRLGAGHRWMADETVRRRGGSGRTDLRVTRDDEAGAGCGGGG